MMEKLKIKLANFCEKHRGKKLRWRTWYIKDYIKLSGCGYYTDENNWSANIISESNVGLKEINDVYSLTVEEFTNEKNWDIYE